MSGRRPLPHPPGRPVPGAHFAELPFTPFVTCPVVSLCHTGDVQVRSVPVTQDPGPVPTYAGLSRVSVEVTGGWWLYLPLPVSHPSY